MIVGRVEAKVGAPGRETQNGLAVKTIKCKAKMVSLLQANLSLKIN